MATVLCLLAILLAGCGSGAPSEQAQISSVVRTYLRAQAKGNGRAACRLLAPTGKSELVGLVITAARGVLGHQPTCPRAIRVLRALVGAQVLGSLVDVRIGRIRISGASARARVLDPLGRFPPQRVGLQREIDGWRIAAVRG